MFDEANGSSALEQRVNETIAEYLEAAEAGQAPDPKEFIAAHSDIAAELQLFFASRDEFERLAEPLQTSSAVAPDAQHDDETLLQAGESTTAPALALTQPAVGASGPMVRFFGDYELLEEIAHGGMGVVYKARQVSLNRIVALKMILAGQLASEEDVKRFHAEAEAAANLDHSGIVPIYEVGQHEGQHYFSMGFVQGSSLSDKVAGGPLPPQEAAQYTKKIAAAVAFAHEHGVIHRDLKPANVLLDGNNEPRVTDFGLAKRVEGDSGLTATGQILGTPGYMPPEQASGRINEVTETADVYSLGAILYCLLTARPPFQADNQLDTLKQVLEREPVSPRNLSPKIPQDLETICLKCLEKDRNRRYASAQELTEELQRFLEGRPIVARPISAPARAWRWCRRNPRIAAMSAALVVVLLAATAISTSFAFLENVAKQEAVKARHEEAEQRRVAEQRQADALWNTYVARMQTLRPVWERGDFGQLEVLLDQYKPQEGEPDFRGWEWRYLRDQCRVKIRVLGTKTPARFAAWRPDGRRLAIRHRTRGDVLIWDTDRGTIVRTLASEGDAPIAWSPDGRWLAAGRGASVLEVWDTATGEKLWEIDCATERDHSSWRPYGLGWSHDGELLAYGGDGFVEIFSRDGQQQQQFRVGAAMEGNSIYALDWHPVDMRLGVADKDGFVYAFDGLSGQQLWRKWAANIHCVDVAWRPDGHQIACSAGYPVSAAKVFDEEGNLVTTLPRVSGQISWSSDGERIAASAPSQFVHIWHVESGERQEMHVHKGQVKAVAWNPTSDQVFTAGSDGTLKLWDATMTQDPALAIHAHPRPPRERYARRHSVAWSPDASQVISGGPHGRVAIWNASNGELTTELVQEGSAVHAVAWHPGGRMVAAITQDGRISIWDVESRQKLKTLTAGSRSIDFQYLNWTRDGQRLLCDVAEAPLKKQKPVYYWEDGGLGERRELTTSDRCNISWHPDGDRIAIQRKQQLEIWSVPEHRTVLTIEDVSMAPPIWEPHGRVLALGEGGLQFFNAHTGERVLTAALHASWAFGDWSPAGDRIVTAGKVDGALKIVDAATADEVFTLATGGAAFTDVAFSPDGRRIATADRAGFVRIWGSPNIEPPGGFDYLATGVLAKVQTPEAELKQIISSIQSRVLNAPSSSLDEKQIAVDVLRTVGAELMVGGKWVTPEGKQSVHHTAVTGLRVTASHYVTPFLLRLIAKLENVEYLEIDGSLLASSDLAELARNESLRELVLINLQLDAAAAQQLASIPSLRRLALRDISILEGEAVASLARVAALHTISLNALSVTDSEVEPLMALTQLKELRLTGTRITPKTVDRLRQELPQTNVVYDNYRQDREAAEWVLRIGGEVHISDSPRPVSNATDLPEHPFRVVTINLSNHADIGDDDLAHLQDLVALKQLDLHETGISDKGLEHLQNLLELKTLNVSDTPVTGSGLAHLARLENLYGLYASNTSLTNDGLSHLPPLPALRSFQLDSPDLTAGYLVHVSRLPSLTSLHVPRDAARPGLEHLRGTRLETLSLNWQSDLPDESLVHLATIPNLRDLSLRGTRCLTADGFRHLAQVRTLERLNLSKTHFDDQAVEAIASLDQLTYLEVTETKLTPAGLAYLKAALPNCEVISGSN